jgi:hypothetical protein
MTDFLFGGEPIAIVRWARKAEDSLVDEARREPDS